MATAVLPAQEGPHHRMHWLEETFKGHLVHSCNKQGYLQLAQVAQRPTASTPSPVP